MYISLPLDIEAEELQPSQKGVKEMAVKLQGVNGKPNRSRRLRQDCTSKPPVVSARSGDRSWRSFAGERQVHHTAV